ncbi:G1/S-specific cyclin Pcl5 [Ophiocordyceps camponoti-floridani]|uniref:G1/S-specific cyclin Pcl5 n=1 Tax=Ophiocordyceps camponoti-floridani TaxID=2030778 RepID=A0A8H4Q2N1_9HYPO|nr:G1/S-specific cyclin Pcl5 [Ophiocordyceps camponoti-floridani]
MTCSADQYVSCARYATFTSSASLSSASSFASTSTSIWSSRSPDDSCLSAASSDSDSCQPSRPPAHAPSAPDAAVPSELRQNPRRTSSGPHGRGLAPPPALIRHSDRRINFVDSLVDSSTHIVEAIWPLSIVCRSEPGSKAVLPLRTFIQETLRRSRTSYSTLQVALYYLVLVKPRVPKHAFAVDRLDDRPADRALQCGRRMFLAALILASKYLQDRNYSARAWSKISGLNTHEINQNEMAFLLAVNWKLHIADDVFQRWTDIVLKCMPPPSPPPPPSADAVTATVRPHQPPDWKRLIMRLDPDLFNAESLLRGVVQTGLTAKTSDLCVLSPRSILNMPLSQKPTTSPPAVLRAPSSSSSSATPMPPASTELPCRPAPTLGSLPTPRLTPSTGGLCTPAAGAPPPHVLVKGGAMGMAMAQAGCVGATQGLDRLPLYNTLSPQCHYHLSRRSSLANSVSTASSPDSMVSDVSSRSSRSSTSSSGSISHGSNFSSRLRVCRPLERTSGRPSVPTVLEDHGECRLTSSPEAYAYACPVGKPAGLYLDTPLARREWELDSAARDAASDAARALQDLHNHGRSSSVSKYLPTRKMSFTTVNLGKRDRAGSVGEGPLHDNVRDILAGHGRPSNAPWPKSMVYSGKDVVGLQFPMRPGSGGSGKRVCCSTEAASMHPALGLLRGPGLWNDILN